MLLPIVASAYNAEINGVFYEFDTNTREAVVTFGDTLYTGSVTIPETVTYNDLTYSVTSIGTSAFTYCSGLTSVIIPNSVDSINTSAFKWCSSLNSVTIPNSVIYIGYQAFYECTGLTSVSIGNSVASIESFAFCGCSGLSSITIPNSVTLIGRGAFEKCSSLTSMSVEKGNTVYDSRDNCNAIINIATNTLVAGCKNTVIPNSVTSIGYLAFFGCSGLTSVTIPNGVSSIGEQAFSWCSSLRHVYCYAESVPKTGRDVFRHSSVSFATLHVPAASLETYKTTTPWNEFYTIVAIDPSGVKTLESTQQDTDKQPDGKYMKNGKIIIIKEGKKYDAAGKLSAF